jgi:hypothetical protein
MNAGLIACLTWEGKGYFKRNITLPAKNFINQKKDNPFMTIRESEARLSILTEEEKRKLAGIRKAIQQGNRTLAVQLATERYQLLKQMEYIQNVASNKEKRTRKTD